MKQINRVVAHSEVILSIALANILYYPLINAFVYLVCEKNSINDTNVRKALYIIEFGIIMVAILLCCLRSLVSVVFPYYLAVVIVVVSTVLFPQNTIYVKQILKDLFVFCIPVGIIGYNISDDELLVKILSKLSYIIIIIGALYTYYIDTSQYNMWLSYTLLPPLSFLILKQVYKFNFIDLCFITLGTATALIFGSRGAMVSIFVQVLFIFVYYLFIGEYRNKNKWHIVFWALFFGLTVLILLLFLTNIFISDVQLSNISSRTLKLLITGDFLQSSGRKMVYREVVNMIVDNPLGMGLRGEMVAFHKLGIEDMYAHNLFLEIIIDFGVFIGLSICFLIIALIVLFMKQDFGKYTDIIFITLFSLGFIPLMISGTYLSYKPIWLFIAFILKKIVKEKQINGKY